MKQKKLKIFIYCLMISFLFLMICSKSSFLYSLNVWADANCFFTMGKAMFNGKILYLDLFDQKGPLLFFYYALASLISYKTFIGVFIIEIVSFAVFLYYAYKTLKLYLKEDISILMLPIISFCILTLKAFTHGGSAEEFILPMLMYSLYSLIKFLKKPNLKYNFKYFMLNGLMAGLVLTIKFSILGFWFGFMLGLLIFYIKKGKWKIGILSSLTFVVAMFIPLIPWIIYFSINNALETFFNSYVLYNILYYPSQSNFTVRLLNVFIKPMGFMIKSPNYGIPFFIGMGSIMFEDKIIKDKISKTIILLTFFFLCLGIFLGGISFRYYYLILTPYMIFGIIRICIYFQENYHHKKIREIIYILLISILMMSALVFGKNTKMLKTHQSLVQYQFGEIINKKKSATLLNYGFLDGGFYTVTGIIPNIKYFQKQNVDYKAFPYIIKAQNKAIKNKKIDFVVTRTNIYEETAKWMTPYLKQNYQMISSICQNYEEGTYRYTLWQKK